VDRGGQHRVGPNEASLDQERNFEVGESSALADASTLAVHGHAAAHHQVHRWQLRGCELPPGPGRAPARRVGRRFTFEECPDPVADLLLGALDCPGVLLWLGSQSAHTS
jgi:hypothetical protein